MPTASHTWAFPTAGPKWAQPEGTTPPAGHGRVRPAIAPPSGLRTVRPMATAPHTTTAPPGPVVVGLEGIQARYEIGRTKAVEVVAMEGFPASVVPGMHRYPVAALEAWELAISLLGTVAEVAPPAPVVIAPPAPGRPGRRPAGSGGAR